MTPATDLDVLRMIRGAWTTNLRMHASAIDVPPFLLTFDAASDLVWINYATPITEAEEDCIVEALPIVREEFHRRHRTLRFEFFDALSESLPPLLERFGLKLHLRMPAMACTDIEDVCSPVHRVERLSADSTEQTIAQFLAVRESAFGPLSPAPIADQIAELRHEWKTGAARSVLVFADNAPAGVATLIGQRPIAELVGVGTAPAHRGRGVARAATAALVADHLDGGECNAVWLTAGNDAARAIYEKIGFRFIGWQSTFIDAAWNK